jgi:hypothetical protein
MDTAEAVHYLARCESHRFRPLTGDDGEVEEELREIDARIGRRIPAFSVRRSGGGSGGLVAVDLERDVNHDNAGRMPYMLQFLNRAVLPAVEPCVDVTGTYPLELHDSYTYLDCRAGYRNVLTFGRAKDALERRVALIPDPYHICNFGGDVDIATLDPVPWSKKEPKLFFAGTTTGDRRPAHNARIRACMWSVDNRDLSAMVITKIAQMRLADILDAHPAFMACTHEEHVPIEAHFRYRYQVDIAGNTAAWSRLPVMMSSRCLVVRPRQREADDMMWYHPLLREGTHYVGADSAEGPDLARTLAFCKSYDHQCRGMVDNANALARDLFHPGTAAAYMRSFMEEAALFGRA